MTARRRSNRSLEQELRAHEACLFGASTNLRLKEP